MGLAAVARRVPLVLAEADSHLGLTNRLLARWARRVCLAFPIAGRDGERYLVTGRPVPPPATDRAAARARFGLAPDDTLRARLRRLAGRAHDQRGGGRRRWPAPTSASCTPAGARDYEALRARLGPDPPANYDLREFITPFGEALLASDLCVARAGGSIFEIAAHGRPAILVPYPHASADHQSSNARWMAQAGAAVVVADAELTPERLASEVRALLGDRPRLQAMGRASASLARPEAAQRIAEEVLAAAR